MHKHEQESRKVGKQSFMYAWVLDETAEERERGITMDVAQNRWEPHYARHNRSFYGNPCSDNVVLCRFETEHRVVTLLDAPGHRDFIPNMISGAYQADCAVLVVNASTGEFEAGFEAGGQTREHALLVRSLGVAQLCIAVNKLDTVDWAEGRFLQIREKLLLFLTRQAGFREADLTFVPCSGLTGENLTRPSATPSLQAWYGSGPTLLQAVDSLRTPARPMEKPFRLAVSDIFRAASGAGFRSVDFNRNCLSCTVVSSVAGRVEAGLVMKDDRLLVSPLSELCTVKSVLVEGTDGQTAFAGDAAVLTVAGPDQTSLQAGMVLCDPANPVPVTVRFQARVVVFR